MIFIIRDDNIGEGVAFNLGCRAIEGVEPIKLPDNIGIMDLYIEQDNYNKIDNNSDLISDENLMDATTFTIMFSPSGKVLVHSLWVRNKDNKSAANADDSEDDIFNSENNVDNGYAQFLQDGESNFPELDIEPSRRAFMIYDRNIFLGLDEGQRFDDYIEDVETIYLNSYTGTMIDR